MQLLDIINKYDRLPGNLTQILLEYQNSKESKYLTEEELSITAKELKIPLSRVYSVAEFYTLISTKPRGRFIIQVCNDVPCYVKGSLNIVNELEKRLKIKMGETTPDNVFTLEFTSCLGCCETAPVIRINDEVYGNLTSKKISKILTEYRRKCNE